MQLAFTGYGLDGLVFGGIFWRFKDNNSCVIFLQYSSASDLSHIFLQFARSSEVASWGDYSQSIYPQQASVSTLCRYFLLFLLRRGKLHILPKSQHRPLIERRGRPRYYWISFKRSTKYQIVHDLKGLEYMSIAARIVHF